MERANDKNFFAACDDLKQKAPLRVSNLFLDNRQVRRKIADSECYFLQSGRSLFLLVPFHGVMYNLYFLSATPEALASDLSSLMQEFDFSCPICTSVIGREEQCAPILGAFAANGFVEKNTLMRMLSKKPEEKILAGMRLLAADSLERVSFAKEEDAEELLELLCEEFDIVENNIPDLGEIKEDIRNNRIVVIREGNIIAAMHYFDVENGISHSYFDVVRKEFRGGNGMIFALYIFKLDHFKREGAKINRFLAWRDTSRPRLIKNAGKTNECPDGIVIHNLLHPAEPRGDVPQGGVPC